jgi:hypothetical protein
MNDTDPRRGAGDVLVLSLDDGSVTSIAQGELLEEAGQWSPDQRWIAYDAQEGGRQEVFVQPFPATGQRWRISTAGGSEALWSSDGRELFYRDGHRLMAVDIRTDQGFSAGAPRPLFDDAFVTTPNGVTGYSIAADGRRFLFPQHVQPSPAPTRINLVLNWFSDLRRVTAAR